jgi:formyl-CoA transferase
VRSDERLRSAAGRAAPQGGVRPGLEQVFATRSAAEWVRLLEAAGVPVAPVHTPAELAGDPLLAALGVLRPAEDGLPEVAFPASGLGVGPDGSR